MKAKVHKEKTQYTTFKAKIAKFSRLPFKETVLLLNVRYYDLMSASWKTLREHVWMENFLPSKKNVQGKEIVFSGVVYDYIDTKGAIKKGIEFTNQMLFLKNQNRIKRV